MIQVEVDRNEKVGFQITLDGSILLTLRTDSGEGIMGSIAFAKERGQIEIVEFHQTDEAWMIHDSHLLGE